MHFPSDFRVASVALAFRHNGWWCHVTFLGFLWSLPRWHWGHPTCRKADFRGRCPPWFPDTRRRLRQELLTDTWNIHLSNPPLFQTRAMRKICSALILPDIFPIRIQFGRIMLGQTAERAMETRKSHYLHIIAVLGIVDDGESIRNRFEWTHIIQCVCPGFSSPFTSARWMNP